MPTSPSSFSEDDTTNTLQAALENLVSDLDGGDTSIVPLLSQHVGRSLTLGEAGELIGTAMNRLAFKVGDVVYAEGSSAILGDVFRVDYEGVHVRWRQTESCEQIEDLRRPKPEARPASNLGNEAALYSFEVLLRRTVADTLKHVVVVDASTSEEAKQRALDLVIEGDPAWQHDSCGGTIGETTAEVLRVDPIYGKTQVPAAT